MHIEMVKKPEYLLSVTNEDEDIQLALKVDGAKPVAVPVAHHNVPHAHAAHHAAHTAGEDRESETETINTEGERYGAVMKSNHTLNKIYTESGSETPDNITINSCCTEKPAASC